MNALHYRILELSYRNKLSHIGSCISCVDLIDIIYLKRQENEPFCLGNSHALLALAVVLEKHYGYNAEEILRDLGTHATRSSKYGIWVSGGSLGQVETVAVGMAMADYKRKVWLLSSDGGAAEGAFWEALGYKAEAGLRNLMWYVNANGFAAYRKVDIHRLALQIHSFDESISVRSTDFCGIPFLQELDAHYHIMTEEDWKWTQENRPEEVKS